MSSTEPAENAHTVPYSVTKSQIREAIQMATDWAFHTQWTTRAYAKGYSGNNPGAGISRTEHAYWTMEEAITRWVRHMSATPGYQRYWSRRIRPVLLGHFREGKRWAEFSSAERRFAYAVLCEAARVERERKSFETD